MTGCGANNPIAPNEPEIETDGVTPDLLTFRAEVLEIDQYYYLRHEEALLFVYSITPVGSHENGGRYFINRNDFIAVLDAYGEPMSYSDIPSGAIVDITYSAVVLQTDPAIIPGATLIQVVTATPEPELIETPATEEDEVEPEHSVEISDEESAIVLEQLAGIWRNDAGHIVEIGANGRVISAENGAPVRTMATVAPCYEEDPESEFPAWVWSIRRTPNSTYVIDCCATHLSIWFFPIGVEMVRDTNWSLVPSDTSRVRMFLGTFSLTACCPDEEILQETFYRTTE